MVSCRSTQYMYDCNTQFMKAGVRGISVLFASGDQGVWGRTGHTDNVFHPDFPAGSPCACLLPMPLFISTRPR